MNICICTYVTFKINNGSCLKHKKGRHSYVSVCYQAYVTRMRSYVTMYPNYYPYDNNHHNHDKKAWSEGEGGGGNRVWDLDEPGKLTRAPLACLASVSNRVSFCSCSRDELAGNACYAGYGPWKTDFHGTTDYFCSLSSTQTFEFVVSITIRTKTLPYQTLLLYIES